jgi:SanA protein
MNMRITRRLLKPLILFSAALLVLIIIANITVLIKSHKYIFDKVVEVPKCYTAIVLGAKVSSKGVPSDFLQDRLDIAIELYNNHKIVRFLMSGDHGQTDYDEVNNMKSYLIKHGINTRDIFLDHAGFDTYSSMVRAKKIFQINDVIIVSQKFHLPRAVYIARSKGLVAYGIKADKRNYAALKSLKFRELLAKVKAFAEVSINKKPKYLGNQIPITGDSKLSYD